MNMPFWKINEELDKHELMGMLTGYCESSALGCERERV